MKQRAVIYTTTNGRAISENLPFIVDCLNSSKGRTIETIDVVHVSPPENPQTIRTSDGRTRFTWDWFERTFTARDMSYDVVCFHFTSYYRKKWGLSKQIKGSYRNDPDQTYEFWVCASPSQTDENYSFSEFTRVFLHEWAHGDGYRVPVENQQNVVHDWDYNRRDIHNIFKTFDFRRWNILRQIVDLLEEFLRKFT